MASGTQNNIKIKLAGTAVYTVRTVRDTATYALNSGGDTAMQEAIRTGTYPNQLTVEDNNVIIPANTVPPSVKPVPISAPTGLTATATSSTAIALSWTGVAGAASYIVERSANGTSGWAQIGTPSSNSFPDSGLTASTQYYYRVRAVSASSTSANSSTANATTQGNAFPAYSQTKPGASGGTFVQSGNSFSYSFTGAPKTDTNYAFSLDVLTTGTSGTGQGGIKVGDGARQVTFNTVAADGGTRPITGTLSLAAGSNTITFEHVSGINFQPKDLTITRAAGA